MSVIDSMPFRRTSSRTGERANATSSYTALMATVREAGLLQRRRGFYIAVFSVLTVALAGIGAGVVLLDGSWFQLLLAGALGILLTQFAFLSHEAAHRQIFASSRMNDVAARVLATGFVGMSHSWWNHKHNRHHGNPNHVGKDPDLDVDTVAFLPEDAAASRGLVRFIQRRQGWLFFPLLSLEGLNLHWLSLKSVFRSGRSHAGRWEAVALVARLAIYLGLVFWLMPIGVAFAFLGVQLAVFGFVLGAAFAPNHVGMPVIQKGVRLDFLRKQVLTSRNLRGGLPLTFAMGGLNHQIEHHLFPSMARPNLAKAREIVREHCAALGVPYTETTVPQAWTAVVRHLHQVGLAAGRDTFACPVVAQYR